MDKGTQILAARAKTEVPSGEVGIYVLPKMQMEIFALEKILHQILILLVHTNTV